MTDWLSPQEWTAVALSLKVAFWATLLSLPVGIAVALALARGNFPGKQLLNGLVHLPLILPPVVTGYLLLIAFGRQGAIGSLLDKWFGVILAFRWTGAVLAAAVMAFPLMVRAIRLAIEAVDPKLEQAASTLGIPDQLYNSGWWEVAEDEALVLDLRPPDCRYWSLSLCDYWGASFDYRYWNIHVNDRTACYRPDGSVRIVIAHRNPGLAECSSP